jgi:putative endonuclease
MNKNNKIGKFGEELASHMLIKKGYLLLARNFREKFDEIDLILRDSKGVLVFCEVKTMNIHISNNRAHFLPEDNLSGIKLKKMIRAARIFFARHPYEVYGQKGWRLDLVTVAIFDDRSIELHHYENL